MSKPRFATTRVMSGAPGATAIRNKPINAPRSSRSKLASASAMIGGMMNVAASSFAHFARVRRRQFARNWVQFRLMPTETINSRTVLGRRNFIAFFPDRRKILLTPAVQRALYCKSQPINAQRTMKTRITNSSLILILAACGIIFFAGCASMETNKTTSLLSAAGFRVRTPQTAKQKEFYAAIPSYKLERATVKGKVFYVFKDEKAGVEYVGGEPEHRRYQQLCMEQ